MTIRKKQCFLILTIALGITVSFSCKKTEKDVVVTPPSTTPDPVVQPPVQTATSYTVPLNTPVYIQNFLKDNPGVGNIPADNKITEDGANLGRFLFYDKSLSVNNTIACASCHHQDKAFTDGEAFSKGFEGGLTRRNAMPLVNLQYFAAQKMFWDFRAATLEQQVLEPTIDKIEMGMPSITALIDKIKTKTYYPDLFKKAFGTEEINSEKTAKALAQFIRSIASFNSKYDQGLDALALSNLSTQEMAGFNKVKQLNCVECHSDLKTVRAGFPTFFTFENSGLNTGFGSNNGLDLVYTDNGIGEKTGLQKDMGTFKMPSLRNVELTAPYMHDGRFKTLEEVLTHYQKGVKNHSALGLQIPAGGYGVAMTDQDKANIIAFLKTLTDKTIATEKKFSSPF